MTRSVKGWDDPNEPDGKESTSTIASFFCGLADMTPLPQIVLGVALLVALLAVAIPDDEKVDVRALVRASCATWAEQMHVTIDGMSCRDSAMECDVHLTDGTRALLRCDRTGCVTR